MGHIVKKKNEDLYMEDYLGSMIWTPSIMEAKVFLTEQHAVNAIRLLRFETETEII